MRTGEPYFPAEVAAFHAGARERRARQRRPGERHDHPGHDTAFALDPDANRIEAVCHGRFHAPAESAVVGRVAVGAGEPCRARPSPGSNETRRR